MLCGCRNICFLIKFKYIVVATNANQPTSESNTLAARLKDRLVLSEFLVSADLVCVVCWMEHYRSNRNVLFVS